MWLEGDLFFISTHTVSERLRDNKLRLSLEIFDEFRERLERAYLVMSIDSPVNLDYRVCRWRISLNKFNISRILKPFKEVVYGNKKLSLLLYDVTPIKNTLSNTNEIYIEYKGDYSSSLDFVGLLTTYTVLSGESRPGVYLFEDPMILESGKKVTIEIPGDPSREHNVYLVLKPLAANTEIVVGNDSRVLGSVEEHTITLPSGVNKFSLEVLRGGVYIPIILSKERRFKEPNYYINEISVLREQEKSSILKIYVDNSGEIDVSEILVVALHKGKTVASKRVSGTSREIELDIDRKSIDTNDPRVHVRVIWSWLGNRYFSSKEAVI
ncbi:MAG: hypothetical protein ACP5I7_03470 [Sulfolobales archaeon]